LLQDAPGTTVREPRDDGFELVVAENHVQLDGEGWLLQYVRLWFVGRKVGPVFEDKKA